MSAAELPRITGTELETCIVLEKGVQSMGAIPGSYAQEILTHGLPTYLGRSLLIRNQQGYFLTNGSKIYPDMSHIEYATPEDSSLWGTVANEIAQEQVIATTLDHYDQKRGLGTYRYHKRIIDATGTTWGYHENYFMLYTQQLPSELAFGTVLAHLATRQVFVGTGHQRSNGSFGLSQKLNAVRKNMATGTINDKPLICTRNEPHTGSGPDAIGQRLQVVCGDPNMSPWATFMKLATTSLVLRLVEHGVGEMPKAGVMQDYASIARQFNHDILLRKVVQLKSGFRVTALNIQEILLDRCKSLAGQVELPTEEQEALTMWEQVLSDLRINPELAADRVEWVLKYKALGRYAVRHNYDERSPKLQEFDMQWDAITDKGTGKILRTTKWRSWTDTELIDERVKNPPANTRALPRSVFISRLRSPYSGRVDWNKLQLGENQSLELANPANNSTEAVDKLLRSVA